MRLYLEVPEVGQFPPVLLEVFGAYCGERIEDALQNVNFAKCDARLSAQMVSRLIEKFSSGLKSENFLIDVIEWAPLPLIMVQFSESNERVKLLSESAQNWLLELKGQTLEVFKQLKSNNITVAQLERLHQNALQFSQVVCASFTPDQFVCLITDPQGTLNEPAPNRVVQLIEHRYKQLERFSQQKLRLELFAHAFRRFVSSGICSNSCLNVKIIIHMEFTINCFHSIC